jgi:hypothetical protein
MRILILNSTGYNFGDDTIALSANELKRRLSDAKIRAEN